MATIIDGNRVKLSSGKVVNAQEGGWFDGQQLFGGTLSQPGQINPSSPQVGAGQMVSSEVNRQSDVAQGLKPGTIDQYLQQQRQIAAPAQPVPTSSGTGAPASAPGTTGQPAQTAGAGAPLITAQPTINLPQMYQKLYDTAGINTKESEYFKMEKDYIEAKGKINDNPFLSEATRVGRVAKIEQLFNERTANIRGEIATKKADVETQLNLQLKQFDINSQQAQTALSQFNTLLQMGALSGATGEDIANITRGTGISSDMIRSAIETAKKKDIKDIKTQLVTSTADSGEVTVSVINLETGEVMKKTSLGRVGNAENKGVSTTDQKIIDMQQTQQNAIGDIQRGASLRDLIAHYAVAGGLTVEEIYRIYNSNSPYGTATETINQTKEGIFQDLQSKK